MADNNRADNRSERIAGPNRNDPFTEDRMAQPKDTQDAPLPQDERPANEWRSIGELARKLVERQA